MRVVTGGAGNLGLSAARAVLEHGASGVNIWDLEATLSSSQVQIASLVKDFPGSKVFTTKVDVTDAAGVTKATGSAVSDMGSIHHFFSFAGIVSAMHAMDTTPEQFRKTLDVNTTGAFICAQAIAKQIAKQKSGGSITLIASVSGHKVNFPQPQVAYNVSKAAVIAMKASLAAEWAVHGIRVNSISPGYMDTVLNEGEGLAEARAIWTGRNPMGRMGAVGELDGVCVLLCSRAGSYITGADFVVDGGMCVF